MAAAGKCCSRRLLGQQVAEALRRQGRRRREDAGVDGMRLRVPGRLRSVGGESGSNDSVLEAFFAAKFAKRIE